MSLFGNRNSRITTTRTTRSPEPPETHSVHSFNSFDHRPTELKSFVRDDTFHIIRPVDTKLMFHVYRVMPLSVMCYVRSFQLSSLVCFWKHGGFFYGGLLDSCSGHSVEIRLINSVVFKWAVVPLLGGVGTIQGDNEGKGNGQKAPTEQKKKAFRSCDLDGKLRVEGGGGGEGTVQKVLEPLI